MLALEQVYCVMWLALQYPVLELVRRKKVIDQRIIHIRRHNQGDFMYDLIMLSNLYSAARAYLILRGDIWTYFIT